MINVDQALVCKSLQTSQRLLEKEIGRTGKDHCGAVLGRALTLRSYHDYLNAFHSLLR